MDSEHRHELEQNDLAVFLTNFGQWWSKYGNWTLITILVLVAGYTGQRLITTQREIAHERAWADLALTTSPDVANSIAGSHPEPVRSLLLLRGADLLLNQVTFPPTPQKSADESGEQKPAAEPARDVAKDLQTARMMYQQVIDSKAAHDVIHYNAWLGIAAVAEAQKNWDEARSIYEKVDADAQAAYPAISAQAKGRLAMLDDLGQPIRIAADPVKIDVPAVTPELTTPAISLDPAAAVEAALEAKPAEGNATPSAEQ